MKTKLKQFGFTLVEMITVMAIIVILIGLSIPTLSWVRRVAKETKQKSQISTISFTLETFKNDYGNYPPSSGYYYPPSPFPGPSDYCGAQKLAEALLGRDLLGFNKYSNWSATDLTFYPTDPALLDASLDDRVGPYLKFTSMNVFKLGDLFGWGAGDTGVLHPDRFVICDVFGIKKITVGTRTITAGTPILYYRANISSKSLVETSYLAGDGIYDFRDNSSLIGLNKIGDVITTHPLLNPAVFYGDPTADPPVIGYIQNPKITAIPWPYRPDSYILISARVDGLYGTGDDITNFGN